MAGKGTISYSNYRKHVTESTYAFENKNCVEMDRMKIRSFFYVRC